jgi:hypothetical protein
VADSNKINSLGELTPRGGVAILSTRIESSFLAPEADRARGKKKVNGWVGGGKGGLVELVIRFE